MVEGVVVREWWMGRCWDLTVLRLEVGTGHSLALKLWTAVECG